MEEDVQYEQIIEQYVYEFHRGRLESDAEVTLYDRLVTELYKPGKEVPLTTGGTGWKWRIDGPLLASDDRCNTVVEAVMADHPEMFWVLWHRYWMRPYADHQEYIFLPYWDIWRIAPLRIAMHQWLLQVAERIGTCRPIEERVRMVCEYLADNVSYKRTKDAACRTIIGCALEYQDGHRYAVCEGFAKAFKYLCDGLDIPVLAVRGELFDADGQSRPHSWNMVQIDNQYYHIDVTQMARGPHGEQGAPFCLRTDHEMIERGYLWSLWIYPPT